MRRHVIHGQFSRKLRFPGYTKTIEVVAFHLDDPMSTADSDLGELLAQVLPAGIKITVRHLSSTPIPCSALFAAPPGEEPEATFCANHFLIVSIYKGDENDSNGKGSEIIVFGMEVLVYSTTHLTTIFVSKADSTGYLHLLQTTSKVSLLRLISNTFLSFLMRTHQRPSVRLVLSLFARAQNQYLFPGSIHNPGKHVLDDRGLIKWWCRVADSILREYEPESGGHEKGLLDRTMEFAKSSATAFLIVPGCDKFETRGFFPPAAKEDDKERPRWVNSYPVRQLCDNPEAPPRCLIPRLPDDPKTRFLIDLDDELPELKESEEQRKRPPGQWLSVRSLEQFWEMMSFRQECSAGRLVGFLWLVINPPGLENSVQMTSSRVMTGDVGKGTTETTASSAPAEKESKTTSPSKDVPNDTKTQAPSSQSQGTQKQTAEQPPFHWPEAGRGDAVLSEADYKTAVDFLLTQDFDNEEESIASTKAWAEKLTSITDQLWVGKHVEGRSTSIGQSASQTSQTTNLIDSGLIRKRKKNDQGQDTAKTNDNAGATSEPVQSSSGVNVLGTNLIRKKKKT